MSNDLQETITAGELMDRQFLPRAVVVERMLPAGTYILAGTPKIGKSFLMTQLCWCVAEGVPFLNLKVKRSSALYLALEDTRERLQARLAQMYGVDWSGERFHLMFQTDCQGIDLVEKLREFMFFHPDTHLIVIDTLQKVRDNGGASYSYSNDYDAITPFKIFTDTYDVALILVHHTRKNTEDPNAFNQISGTNGLLGAADGAFLLHKVKDEVILEQTGRDMPSQRYALRFDKEHCRWDLLRLIEASIKKPPDPLLKLVDQVVVQYWTGPASELLEQLLQLDPTLAYQPNTLSRKLNSMTQDIEQELGIVFRSGRMAKQRWCEFVRQSESDDNDANDDKTPGAEIPSLSSFASSEGGEPDG